MKLVLIKKRREAGDAVSFVFKPEAPFMWHAGQFLHYRLPHENPDGRGIDRWFTISSAPHEGRVATTTRFFPKGSSFKKALAALPVGATIEADGPDGDFVLDTDLAPDSLPQPKPLDRGFVFIAGGIGITPFRAILLDLDHRNISIRGTLLYANRDAHFVFGSELERFAQKHPGFKIVYFAGEQKIDEAAVRREVPDLIKPMFYISGPEPMVEVYEKMLYGMGVPEEHVKRDYFPGYA